MMIVNSSNQQLYSTADITDELGKFNRRLVNETVKSMYPKFSTSALDTNKLRHVYARLLVNKPTEIPNDIEPRPEIRSIKLVIGQKNLAYLREKVLPLYFTPIEINATKKLSLGQIRERLFKKIVEDGNLNKRSWQTGSGLTVNDIDHEGMSTTDIENVLEKETHRMVPVIASDEIPSLAHFVGPKTKSFGFVINSQDHTKGGKHWRAVFIDRRSASVCFFDSLVSQPTKEMLKGIKILVDKMDDPVYFKLKVNGIKYQSNDTSTCGAFALRFIDQMYEGKPFKESSGFEDKHVQGEKDIRKYISRWGYI